MEKIFDRPDDPGVLQAFLRHVDGITREELITQLGLNASDFPEEAAPVAPKKGVAKIRVTSESVTTTGSAPPPPQEIVGTAASRLPKRRLKLP